MCVLLVAAIVMCDCVCACVCVCQCVLVWFPLSRIDWRPVIRIAVASAVPLRCLSLAGRVPWRGLLGQMETRLFTLLRGFDP